MKKILFFIAFTFSICCTFADDCSCGAREENPEKPCPCNDLCCVKKFFQCRSKCGEDLPQCDKLHKDEFQYYLAYLNATAEQTNVTISGLNSGKLVDFMADYGNNLLVLTLSFVNITFSATTDYVNYQPAKQPKHVTTDTTELYPSATITTIFYDAKCPNVDNMFSISHLKGTPSKTLGPCAIKNKDKPVLKGMNANINVAIADAFNARSKIIAIDFIQKNLCNYGAEQSHKCGDPPPKCKDKSDEPTEAEKEDDLKNNKSDTGSISGVESVIKTVGKLVGKLL